MIFTENKEWSLLYIVGMHLKDTFGEIVAVLHNHKHSFFLYEFLYHCIYKFPHLFGLFHCADEFRIMDFG